MGKWTKHWALLANLCLFEQRLRRELQLHRIIQCSQMPQELREAISDTVSAESLKNLFECLDVKMKSFVDIP